MSKMRGPAAILEEVEKAKTARKRATIIEREIAECIDPAALAEPSQSIRAGPRRA